MKNIGKICAMGFVISVFAVTTAIAKIPITIWSPTSQHRAISPSVEKSLKQATHKNSTKVHKKLKQ